jgi:methionyl-tRNA formyltransferase
MKTFVVVSEKPWHLVLFNNLRDANSMHNWILINSKEDFTDSELKRINPDKVFIPHWSYIISSRIYLNYALIVFHMTDLPFGRGGSPLQNLILRGFESTKISALRVDRGIDTGDIYLKKELSLLGSAEEIFIRASKVIFLMINDIINFDIKPTPQEGLVTEFKRRKPEEGDISKLNDIDKVYDYIRMLDASGYPRAFLEIGDLRLEFSRATLETGENIIADVRIFKK